MLFVQQWNHNSKARRKIVCDILKKVQKLKAVQKRSSNMSKLNLHFDTFSCLHFLTSTFTNLTLFCLDLHLFVYSMLELSFKQKWHTKQLHFNARTTTRIPMLFIQQWSQHSTAKIVMSMTFRKSDILDGWIQFSEKWGR